MASRANVAPYGISAAPNFGSGGGAGFPGQDTLANPATPLPPGGGNLPLGAPLGPVAPHTGITPPGSLSILGNKSMYTANSRGLSAISTNDYVTSFFVSEVNPSDPDSVAASEKLRVGMLLFAQNPDYPAEVGRTGMGLYGKHGRMMAVDSTRKLRVQFMDLDTLNTFLAKNSDQYTSVQDVVQTWSFSGFLYREASPYNQQQSLSRRAAQRMVNLIVSHRGSSLNAWSRFYPIRGTRLFFIYKKSERDVYDQVGGGTKRRRLPGGNGATESSYRSDVWKVLPWTSSYEDFPTLGHLMYTDTCTLTGSTIPCIGAAKYIGLINNYDGQYTPNSHVSNGASGTAWQDTSVLKRMNELNSLKQAEIMFRI